MLHPPLKCSQSLFQPCCRHTQYVYTHFTTRHLLLLSPAIIQNQTDTSSVLLQNRQHILPQTTRRIQGSLNRPAFWFKGIYVGQFTKHKFKTLPDTQKYSHWAASQFGPTEELWEVEPLTSAAVFLTRNDFHPSECKPEIYQSPYQGQCVLAKKYIKSCYWSNWPFNLSVPICSFFYSQIPDSSWLMQLSIHKNCRSVIPHDFLIPSISYLQCRV